MVDHISMLSSMNEASVFSPQFGITCIRVRHIPRKNHCLSRFLIFTSTATTTIFFPFAHRPRGQDCSHHTKISSTSTSPESFSRSSSTIIFRNFLFQSQAVGGEIPRISESSSALMPCLLVTINHQIRKRARRGIRSLWSAVQAVTQRVALHQEQIRTLRVPCLQYSEQPHFGHFPSHRISSNALRQKSSVENSFRNSIIFLGYCIVGVYLFWW